MDKDRIEGKAKDIKGRVKRQVGEWTGDTDAQVSGTLDQAEGKVQHAVGKAKDAMKDASKEAEERDRSKRVEHVEIERKEEDVA
jgi:uncharacterized protein YjbJ (UPF0337 family)